MLLNSRFIARGIIFAAMAVGALYTAPASAKTDAQIRKEIIAESIAEYPGNCPCPYNTDRAGRSCGRRSAYSKPGGYSPICYPKDISDADLKARRKLQEKPTNKENAQ